MAPSPLFDSATAVDKDAVTIRLLVRVDELCARLATMEAENSVLRTRVAELEAKLGLPPKTPNNSSTPPSQGRKASGEEKKKSEGERRKAHAGAHRPLHPDPTSRRDVTAKACQHCGADVSQRPQTACEAYDMSKSRHQTRCHARDVVWRNLSMLRQEVQGAGAARHA